MTTTRPIVFDGEILVERRTGVGRALVNVLPAYVERSPRPVVLLVPHADAVPDELREVARLRIEIGTRGFAARQLRLPRLLRSLDAALLHAPVVAVPWGRVPCPLVATVHDVPWLEPELRNEPGSRWRARVALRRAMRRTDAIVTPSRATADAIARWLGQPPSTPPVRVVPNAVVAPTIATAHGHDSPYLLAFGDARPRKNLARLREAHTIARARHPDVPTLRIVGDGTEHGWVEERDKGALLAGAHALCQPSLLEGFGLPIVEAFWSDVPVLCSDRGAQREIADDAARFVDAFDTESIAAGILDIATDDALRAELRQRGRTRRHAFRPERVAAALVDLHDEVLR